MAGTMMDGTTRLHKNDQMIHHHVGISAFAEYAVIFQKALVKFDPQVSFQHAALFGCAVITGVGSVVNTAQVSTGQTVAIVGMGGVGLSAVLATRASGAGRIIAVDVKTEKLELALQLGAHGVYNAASDGCAEEIRRDLGGGVHVAVETAGSPQALEMAYKITRRGGTTVTIGMPSPETTITLSPLNLVAEERCLKGSYMGSCVASRDIPRYMDLFRDGRLPVDRLMSRTITFDELNESFDRLADVNTVHDVLLL